MHYGSWSFTEAYNLPIPTRTWFLQKLSEVAEKENEALGVS